MTNLPRIAAGLLVTLGAAGPPAHALLFRSTADPGYNTTAPTGDLAGSGWHWQGNWVGFSGTPVGTNWFLTAKHVGGRVGDALILDGVSHITTASFADPNTDLRLWRVCTPFDSFAPLHAGSNEAGRVGVLLGRGLGRGSEMVLTNGDQLELRGWRWGGAGGVLRWGLNRISGYEDYNEQKSALLRGTFDENGGADEAMLTGGDSGGGVFVQRAGRWELAGIALAVDGPFSYTPDGPGVNAALFDRRGFYESSGDGWTLIPNEGLPRPAAFYATRVSSRLDWIMETMRANPEPASEPTVLSASVPGGPYVTTAAVVDPEAREIRMERPGSAVYLQLESCRALEIVKIRIDGDELVLEYK